MYKPLYFFGQQWYRLINPTPDGSKALLADYPDAYQHLIICVAPPYLPGSDRPFATKEGKQARMFTVFRDVLAFWEYLRMWPADLQNFFEIVPGSRSQKPHFDIDIAASKAEEYQASGHTIDSIATMVLSRVIEGSLAIFQQWNLTPHLEEQLLVYSSHGSEKRSFHVVWNGYCHANHREAEAFYDAVIAWITQRYGKTYTELIDSGVYSVLQNFRLLGSSKAGSNRTKVLHSELNFGNGIITHQYRDPSAHHSAERRAMVDLTESLLSETSSCDMLPRLISIDQMKRKKTFNSDELTEEEVDECMIMLQAKMEDAPFTVRSVDGNMIMLSRRAPSWCPVCTDQTEPHQAEHPYIFISDHVAYWNCRRNQHGTSLKLGYLLSRARPVSDISDAASVADDTTDNWQIQWGPAEAPVNLSIVKANIPNISIVGDSSSSMSGSPTYPLQNNHLYTTVPVVTPQERVKQVQAIYQQQKEKRAIEKSTVSISAFLGQHNLSQNPVPVISELPIHTSSPSTKVPVAKTGRRIARPSGAP